MPMKTPAWRCLVYAAALCACPLPAFSAGNETARPAPEGIMPSATYRTDYVQLGMKSAEGLLYTPAVRDARARIALLYVHPNGNTFTEPMGPQMSARGHLALMVNYHGDGSDKDDSFGPAISQGIRFLRALPGVERVILVGHSGGGHLAAWYANTAQNGPGACSGADKIYPCDKVLASGLEKPDGLVLLDPTLGTLHQANAIDPATRGEQGAAKQRRIAALDMFAAANGYDAKGRKANYSPAFVARFNAAQAARSRLITAAATARLKVIEAGKGHFRDDEPLVIPGMGNMSAGARLFQPDIRLLHHTRGSYVTLMADGSRRQGQIVSVRPPLIGDTAVNLGTLGLMTRNTTVRQYLASSAIRIGPDFALTEDDIRGVDWSSAAYSTPGNARGITVPSLILSMSCHYLVVPDEVIFENLASADKTYMAVEGATHLFQPCRGEYGDTMKRTFDAVGEWVDKEGRF